MQNKRIRINLKAFDHGLIDQATTEIADTQRALHCSDLPARQQRRARSVRNPYSLASG